MPPPTAEPISSGIATDSAIGYVQVPDGSSYATTVHRGYVSCNHRVQNVHVASIQNTASTYQIVGSYVVANCAVGYDRGT